jgi:oxygen-dependent protoporphyrinogen oxidase
MRAAPLLAPLDPMLSALNASVPYTGSSIWTFGYRREDVKHALDAFGFLVPRSERSAIMACTWLGTKWRDRVPADKAVFRCFSTDADTTREAAEADLRRLMNISVQPLFAVHNRWPDTMPQYTVGHSARVEAIESRISEIPGIYVAGNAYHGIGIPDCVRSGKKAAEAAVA